MAARRYNSAPTPDSEADYSEDFDEDDDDLTPPPRSYHRKEKAPPTRGARGRGRGQGRGRGHGRHSQAKSETQLDVVTKRLLSASRFKINELQNRQEEMRKEMMTLKDENKLYKRMQHKQEKALVKFEDREAELPQLIQSHNNEVRTLREQLRRTRDKYDKTDRYLRDAEDELEATKKRLKKYKNLSEEKDLAERSDLSRRLNQAELGVEEKDSKIKELERHLEMLKKNHRHELGIERARSKDVQKQLDEAKETNSKLEAQLKEKDRQLDSKNIYSNRLLKPSSQGGTPAGSPAPWRQNLKKKSESMTDLSPRNKAKAYEQRRKDDDKKKQARASSRKPEPKQKWEEEDREKDAVQDEGPDGPNFNFSSLKKEDSEADFWRRQEERYKKDLDNRDKQSADEQKRKAEEEEKARFQQQREKFQRDMEDRERAERERREADARENSLRERREADARENSLREDRERKEREDRERKEREDREREERERREAERREQERKEKEKLDNDPRLAEEKRKKEELLRRLQQMDANRDGSQPSGGDASGHSPSKVNGDPFSSPPRGKPNRDPFLFGRGDSSESTLTSSRKDYSFTRSVENMHKGKPSHEDVSVAYIDRQKKIKASKEDAEVGGYQPSFVSPGKTTSQQKKPLSLFDDSPPPRPAANKPPADTQEKKSKLMADLFGSSAATTTTTGSAKKDDGDNLFTTSSKPRQVQPAPKKTSGFPWDEPASAKTNGTSQRESSTLFGGGAALVDDDSSAASGPKANLLPRRTRQPAATLSSKPTVNAVDDLDDDIEEVIL